MKKKFILGSLILCTILLSCEKQQTGNEVHKNSSKSESVSIKENKYPEEYISLINEGDSLVNSDLERAKEKYLKAKELCPTESEAYVKLINLCNASEDFVSAQAFVIEAEATVTVLSTELSLLINEEKQKDWYYIESFEDVGNAEGDFIFPNSSVDPLSDKDLFNLNKEELRVARSEIFARHGYIFYDEDLKQLFNSFDWYTPTIYPEDFNIEIEFNDVEKANIALIEKYEAE